MGSSMGLPSREERSQGGENGLLFLEALVEEYESQREQLSNPVDLYNALAARLDLLIRQMGRQPEHVRSSLPNFEFVHVLVVDDSPLALDQTVRVVNIVMRDAAIRARACINKAMCGSEALATMRGVQQQVANGNVKHILVLDMMLPDMSGVDVLEAIKADEVLSKRSYVAVSTGFEDSSRTQLSLDAGAVSVFYKPFTVRKALQTFQSAGIDLRAAFAPKEPSDVEGASTHRHHDCEPPPAALVAWAGATCEDESLHRRRESFADDDFRDDDYRDESTAERQEPAVPSKAARAHAWDSQLANADGSRARLADVHLAGRHLLLVFISSTRDAVRGSDWCRNLLVQLNYYAQALEQTGTQLVVVSCESAAAVTQVHRQMTLRFALFSDPDLVVSSVYCARGSDVTAPSLALVLLDARRRVVESLQLPTDSLGSFKSRQSLIECAFSSTSRSSGPNCGAVSAAHACVCCDDANEDPWLVASFLARCAVLNGVEGCAHELARRSLRINSQHAAALPTGKRYVCVVVEDSSLTADLLIRKLLLLGHCALYAPNGKDALTILRRFPDAVDLVLSDVLMPLMDGVELLSHVKLDPSLQHIPFVLQTGVMQGNKLDNLCADLGGARVMQKPIQMRDLTEVIADVLGEFRATSNKLKDWDC